METHTSGSEGGPDPTSSGCMLPRSARSGSSHPSTPHTLNTAYQKLAAAVPSRLNVRYPRQVQRPASPLLPVLRWSVADDPLGRHSPAVVDVGEREVESGLVRRWSHHSIDRAASQVGMIQRAVLSCSSRSKGRSPPASRADAERAMPLACVVRPSVHSCVRGWRRGGVMSGG